MLVVFFVSVYDKNDRVCITSSVPAYCNVIKNAGAVGAKSLIKGHAFDAVVRVR